MNPDTVITLVIGILTVLSTVFAAVLAAVLPQYLNERQGRNRQRYKLLYIKVYRLRKRVDGTPPNTQAFVERLGREVPVYDELHYYRLNIFNSMQKELSITDRTSGIVDLQILHPYQPLIFTDKPAGMVEKMITQTMQTDSSVYFTRAIFYNGFQPGDEDISMKMERDTEEARLIVDFTAIPNYDAVVAGRPRGTYETTDGTTQLTRTVETQELSSGIFAINSTLLTAGQRNKYLKQGDVLLMKFSINWDAVEATVGAQSA